MEEIVANKEYSDVNTDNRFCKLKHLQLQYLLLDSAQEVIFIELPSLKLLHLEDCLKLRAFIFDGKSESITIHKETEEKGWKENLETAVKY